MHLTKILPLLITVMLASCDMEPSHSRYGDVVIPVNERLVPATAVVNEPFTIWAMASLDNGCWSNIRFFFAETDEREFELFALADFETYGVCPEMIVTDDTLITITPTRTGNHVLTIWMDDYNNVKDTILVVEAIPGK